MRRLFVVSLLLLTICAVTGCDGSDDDGATPTATPPPPATSTSAAASQTPLASGIVINDPAEDAAVTSPVTMSGAANVFEGALTIDALGNAAGLVLCRRHVRATSGTGTPGTWKGILAFQPPPTDGPITLRAYTFSAMDGSMQDLVERSVTASAEMPNIVITSPSCAAEVSAATLSVEGMASVFEAVLFVDIRDAGGTALLTERVMASGTEFSPWAASFDVSGLTPGFYDIVAYNLSAREGAIENEFPVQVSVGP
jgi:hypothetical protein